MSNQFDAFSNFGTQFGFNTQATPGQNQQNPNMMMNFNTQVPNQQQQQGFQNQFNTHQGQNVFQQFDGFGGNGAQGQGQPQQLQPQQQLPQQQNQLQQQQFTNQQMGQPQQMAQFNQGNMMYGFQQPMNQFGQMTVPPVQQMQMPQVDQFGNPIQQQIPQQVPFEAPKPQKLRVKLENSERGVYSALYSQVDSEETNNIKQEKAMELFNRANLNSQIIQNIWQICIPEGDKMDKDAFYVALRLIAYAQNNIEVSSQSIYQNIKAPSNPKFAPKTQPVQQQPILPPQDLGLAGGLAGQQMNSGMQQMPNQGIGMAQQFGQQPQIQQQQFGQQAQIPQQQQQQSQFAITPPLYQKYELYFDATDVKKIGRVDGLQAKEIFSKSKLPNDSLKLIWKLADSEKKGYLTKLQFIIMVHFVYLAKKGIAVPQSLPAELVKFIQSNGQSVFQQQNEIPLINNNNMQMGVGSNELLQQQQQQWQFQQPNAIQPAVPNQQSPQVPLNNNANPDQFNANLLTPPQQQSNLQTSPSQPIVGQFGSNQSSNLTMNNVQPIKADVFNQIDLMNTTPQTIAPTVPIVPEHQKNQASFDMMDLGGISSQLNNMNITDYSALNNIAPQIIQQQPIQQMPIVQAPVVQPPVAAGGISLQQNKEFENSFQQQQQQLSGTFEETRAIHSNFMDQQKQQLDIFNQIIEAYTKTNKKFADENDFLKEEIKNLQEKQQVAIHSLHEIGRNFHLNLQTNKQLRQEVIETASNSIQAITNKATEVLQQNNGQDQSYQGGYNNGYGQDNFSHQDHSNTQAEFNQAGGSNGFDISSQFNHQADPSQQQQWGGGFDNTNGYSANEQQHNNWQ